MYPGLKSYIQKIKDGASDISEERKSKVTQLTEYIRDKKDSSDSAKVTFICTHNSRRSHLCQIRSAVMADYFELDNVETFSGGTEATAFNRRLLSKCIT